MVSSLRPVLLQTMIWLREQPWQVTISYELMEAFIPQTCDPVSISLKTSGPSLQNFILPSVTPPPLKRMLDLVQSSALMAALWLYWPSSEPGFLISYMHTKLSLPPLASRLPLDLSPQISMLCRFSNFMHCLPLLASTAFSRESFPPVSSTEPCHYTAAILEL